MPGGFQRNIPGEIPERTPGATDSESSKEKLRIPGQFSTWKNSGIIPERYLKISAGIYLEKIAGKAP